MCLPVPLIAAAAGLAGTAASIVSAKKADKKRDQIAAQQKQQADAARTDADLEQLQERKKTYSERTRTRSNYNAQPAQLFSGRSFFSAG